jgi:hypothetical protein
VGYYWKVEKSPTPRRIGVLRRRAQRTAEIAEAKRRGVPVPERLRRIRLRGAPRTARLRQEIREEAYLSRAPFRVAAAVTAWVALIVTFCLVPYAQDSWLHFVLIVFAPVPWCAAFSRKTAARSLAAFALCLLAIVLLTLLGEPGLGILVGLPALYLAATSLPIL